MPSQIKDYIGLNILINDPISTDSGSFGENTNTFGYEPNTTPEYSISSVNQNNILPILLTHRNGPWGYCTWKQVRTGENAISRLHRKNNKFTFVKKVVEKVIVKDGKRTTVPFRNPQIQVYDGPAVVSKHQPLTITLYRQSGKLPKCKN